MTIKPTKIKPGKESVRVFMGLSIFLNLFTPTIRGETPPSPKSGLRSPILWGSGLTLAALMADRSLHNELTVRDNNFINKALGNGRIGRQGTIMEMMGEPYMTLGLSGVFYGAGAYWDNPRALRVGRAGVLATIVAGGATLGLKWAIGRNRPYSRNDPDEVHPFHGSNTAKTSMPSGHAAISFAMASVIADEYDDWRVDTLSYGAASLVSVSRIYQDRHWLSDVVGGATLGIVIGKWARRRAARKDGALVSTDGRRVYLSWRF